LEPYGASSVGTCKPDELGRMGYDWTKVLNEGAEAGLDGLSVDSCPYSPGSPEFEVWVSGWRCASEALEAATNGIEFHELAAE
jgi:ribosome modulation factor